MIARSLGGDGEDAIYSPWVVVFWTFHCILAASQQITLYELDENISTLFFGNLPKYISILTFILSPSFIHSEE